MKTCTKCHKPRPLADFGPDRRNRDGLLSHCRRCRSTYQKSYSQRPHAKKWQADYNRKSLYGVTPDEWATMSAGGCAVCGDTARLAVDHDHRTGQVRGALCVRCNRALGLLRDDPARIRNLVAYAERFVS